MSNEYPIVAQVSGWNGLVPEQPLVLKDFTGI
ncbi:hypothetical protein LP7551_02997 [Roseibium album]|jgi:hypothetical protein|nr:hypothetical protein LP7551_02997 [Roseibium album]